MILNAKLVPTSSIHDKLLGGVNQLDSGPGSDFSYSVLKALNSRHNGNTVKAQLISKMSSYNTTFKIQKVKTNKRKYKAKEEMISLGIFPIRRLTPCHITDVSRIVIHHYFPQPKSTLPLILSVCPDRRWEYRDLIAADRSRNASGSSSAACFARREPRQDR